MKIFSLFLLFVRPNTVSGLVSDLGTDYVIIHAKYLIMELIKHKGKGDLAKRRGPSPRRAKKGGTRTFVVQRHDASRLHFDFRLEIGGVLKSWAVPKGPSMNPHEKRLALIVEDHPLSYARFEGTIPDGQYGAGKVTIWDSGTWEPAENFSDVEKAIADGLLEFTLKGRHLKGGFILVEMEYSTERNGWLLIKREDEEAVEEPYDAAEIK